MAQIRQPAVAGQFYPSSPKAIRQQIESFCEKGTEQKEAIACMLPHAGYMYSGAVACSVVARIKIRDNLIILGPNHTGLGKPFSILAEGSWLTPLGNASINTALANALLKRCSSLAIDTKAHQFEHSIEVELPILQYYKKDFSFVPIVVAAQDLESYQRVGEEIASAIKDSKLDKETLIIASSDMTHYEDAITAKEKDSQAIKAILELDEKNLWSVINKLDITMCGYGPAIIMISAAKGLGAKNAELVRYQTSGDVTGDNSSVVGYAGIIIT